MDARYYRDEAELCLELAAGAADSKTAKRWHRLADRYAVLALAASETGRAPLRMPVRQQRAQQQQSRTQPR